jgi:hypothetical protein
MNQLHSSLCLVLIAVSIHGCVLNKSATRDTVAKALHGTIWIVYNPIERTRTDTIMFSFGNYDPGGELDLIAYNSNGKKELLEFKIIRDSILFDSYSISPPFVDVDFNHCVIKNALIYNNQKLKYVSIVSHCSGKEKQHLTNPSLLRIEKR